MSDRTKVAVFASGNGTNAERLFEYFQNHEEVFIELLCCNKINAPVLERAHRWSIPTYVFGREELSGGQLLDKITSYDIDWIVLAGFLWLIPQYLLEKYSDRIINLHPSLLPKYGGKGMYGQRVHQRVINSGDVESGITVHLVNERYDEGKILFQHKCKVDSEDTPDSLAAKIHQLEYQHFPIDVEKIICNK